MANIYVATEWGIHYKSSRAKSIINTFHCHESHIHIQVPLQASGYLTTQYRLKQHLKASRST